MLKFKSHSSEAGKVAFLLTFCDARVPLLARVSFASLTSVSAVINNTLNLLFHQDLLLEPHNGEKKLHNFVCTRAFKLFGQC